MWQEVLLMVFLLLLAFAGIVYLSWKYHPVGTKRCLLVLAVFIISLVAFRSITHYERTKDWQTYRNETYGFEFRYPNDSEISQRENIYNNLLIIDVADLVLNISRYRNINPEVQGYFALIDWQLANVYYNTDMNLHTEILLLEHDNKYFIFSGSDEVDRDILRTFHFFR